MTVSLLLCASLLMAAPHDPVTGEAHPAHRDDAQWKRPAPSAQPVYLGKGKHRFRWDSQWLQLPEDRKWLGNTHGCIVPRQVV